MNLLLLVAGVAAFVAGALSMVAGDHVSVPFLADTGTADDEQTFSKGVTR